MAARHHDHQYAVLVLYDPASLHVGNTRDHLLSLSAFTLFTVHYADAVGNSAPWFDLDDYDAVVIHYSCCLYRPGALHPGFVAALERFSGPKVLFLQDEYDLTVNTIAMLRRLSIDVFFTTVAPESVEKVYPRAQVGDVEFVHTLTGYVPLDLKPREELRPLRDRPLLVGYRARRLAYRYGDLGWDKFRIGARMRDECRRRGLPCDIEWDEDKRIYGEHWPAFVESCRVTLGSESGSNVFDHDGSLRRDMDAALAAAPDMTYEQARSRFLVGREGAYGRIGSISPRVFEAVALKTALVMFEGSYSGVVEPGRHYIELARDFANLDEVMDKIADTALLEEMTERAYDDVIESGRWSHARLAEQVAGHLRRRLPPPRRRVPPALRQPSRLAPPPTRHHPLTTIPLNTAAIRDWRESSLPAPAIPRLEDLEDLRGLGPVVLYGDGRGAALLRRALVERGIAVARTPILPETDLTGQDPDRVILLTNQYVPENAQRLMESGLRRFYNAHPLVRRLAETTARNGDAPA